MFCKKLCAKYTTILNFIVRIMQFYFFVTAIYSILNIYDIFILYVDNINIQAKN